MRLDSCAIFAEVYPAVGYAYRVLRLPGFLFAALITEAAVWSDTGMTVLILV